MGQVFQICLFFCFYLGASALPLRINPPHVPSGFPLKFRASFSLSNVPLNPISKFQILNPKLKIRRS